MTVKTRTHSESVALAERYAVLPLPSLDPLETAEQVVNTVVSPATQEPASQPGTFIGSGCRRMRHRIRGLLVQAGTGQGRIDRWDACATNLWCGHVESKPEETILIGSYCHDRFCPICGTRRTTCVRSNLEDWLKGKTVRLVTLTLRTETEPLLTSVKRLYLCFKRLRRTTFWKEHVTGGTAVLECKWNAEKQKWHPHLHMVCEGKYIPQAELSNAWFDVTGDSRIVDVRLIRQDTDAVNYVTKYLTKQLSDTLTHQPDRAIELIKVLQGRRMLLSFGTWQPLKLTREPQQEKLVCDGPLDSLLARAYRGEPAALETLTRLQRRYPWLLATDGP